MSEASANKPVIGIVGGVGAGKTTVASEFGKLGCAVIDADQIGHELLGDRDIREQLRNRWGENIFDTSGAVNRKALAAIVFRDETEPAALNAIMHGRIRECLRERIAEAVENSDIAAVVLDAPVLIEAGWASLCTHLIFVKSSDAERLMRVRASRCWDEATWRRRENLQKSLDTKARMCDYTIDNSSSVSRLVAQIRSLFQEIVETLDRP